MSMLDKIKDRKGLKVNLISNLIFLICILAVIGTYIKKDQKIEIPVISGTDSQVVFAAGNIIEQTWQPNIKEICMIKVPYTSQADFEGEVKIEFLSDDRTQLLADAAVQAAFQAGERGTLEFSFKSFDVSPGKRYRIRMQYMNYSEEGSILLDANTNYRGCSIDEITQDKAAGFLVTGIKTNKLSFLTLSCFPFFSIAFLFMVLFRRKWEDTIGLSFILITLLMMAAGMCNILKASISIIYILAILSFGAAVWLYNRNDLQLRDIISPGLFVFAALMVFVIINCRSLYLSRSDEFLHWGLSVKDMYCFDSLTKHEGSVIPLTYYPPFMPLIEYFFTYINRLYSDSVVYIGCQMMLISCLVIACKAAEKKKKVIVPIIVVIMTVPLLFFTDIFSSLYTDAALAIFVVYVLSCYYLEKMSAFNFLRIIGGLAALTFTKPTGVVLAVLIGFMMLGDSVWSMRKEQIKIKKLLIPGLCIILSCAFFFVWQGYLKVPIKTEAVMNNAVLETADNLSAETAIDNTPKEVSVKNIMNASGISVSGIINFLSGEGPEYRYDTVKTYFRKVFLGDSFTMAGISFSCFEVILLVCLLAWLFDKVIICNNRMHLLSFGILGALAGAGYGLFLLITYLFSFSQTEAVSLAHIERYFGSWLCGMMLVFFILALNGIAKEGENNCEHERGNMGIFLIMLLIFVSPTQNLLERRSDVSHMEEYAYAYDKAAEVARSYMKRGDRICFLGERTNYKMFSYAICPVKVDHFDMENLSKWMEKLNEYQYVFILEADSDFKKECGEVFEESEEILDVSFYQVDSNNNDIVLKYIGTTEAIQYRQE